MGLLPDARLSALSAEIVFILLGLNSLIMMFSSSMRAHET